MLSEDSSQSTPCLVSVADVTVQYSVEYGLIKCLPDLKVSKSEVKWLGLV